MPGKNPVGRPKKRPKIEADDPGDLMEIEARVAQLRKPAPISTIDSESEVEVVEEVRVKKEVKKEVKEEVREVPVKKEVEEPRSEVNGQLAGLGLGPMVEMSNKRKFFLLEGKKGAEHGVKGAQYGRLGGRPKTSRGTEKRLRASPKKRDDSFGFLARIEVAELVDKVLEICSKRQWDLDEVYTYLSQQTGRPKHKIKWAHENVDQWREYVEKLKLGKGSKGTLNKRGQREGYSMTFSTSKGLRAPGGGAKAVFAPLYPAVKLFFYLERANGRYVDREDLVVS